MWGAAVVKLTRSCSALSTAGRAYTGSTGLLPLLLVYLLLFIGGTDGTRMHYGEPVEALSIILLGSLCVWQSHEYFSDMYHLLKHC